MQATRPAATSPLPVEGLTDLTLVRTPTGGLARPEEPATALTVRELIEHARASMSPGHTLRILADDGARNAAMLGLVADGLNCDILVTPAGAKVEQLAAVEGERGEAVPVDRASGAVVDWVLLQLPSLATALPGWFDLAGGLVLHRAGLAMLPLAGGLEFANRDDFVVRRAAAAGLGVGHPGLVTVAVATRDGAFRLSPYHPALAGRGHGSGQDVAAALSSVYLYGGDLRLWLRWPDNATEQRQVRTQVIELADLTGATVWTPEIGGEAVLLRGCRDLAARDRAGAVTGWTEYRPSAARAAPRFATDRDGRLMPSSPPITYRTDGVALISTGRLPEKTLRERYADIKPEPGSMLMDLTVLDDGRLGMRLEDGTDLAVGAAELRARLSEAGWQREDLLLLTPVTPDGAPGLRGHLSLLESELGVEIWSPQAGATVVAGDGLARAVDEHRSPARWVRSGSDETARWRNDDGHLIPRRRRVVATARVAAPAPVQEPVVVKEPLLPPPSPRPPLALPTRVTRPHSVRWLPDQPEITAAPVNLWLPCEWSPERVAAEGVPAANLYLIGHLDGERVAQDNARRNLLCVRVEAGGAVDLTRLAEMPADLRHQAAASAFLLPAGWLDQTKLQAGYQIDDTGKPGERIELPPNPVTLRCTGARHGTDGLPNEVVNWPRGERGGNAWALLPEAPATSDTDHLALHLRRPEVKPGHRLLHLHVGANRAIDVTASAAGLVELSSVRSRLPALVAGGLTLLLPRRAWDRTRVDQVLRADGGKWRHVSKGIDLPLSSLVAID